MKEIITKKILEIVGDNRKGFKSGTFLEHRDEYNKGYNKALQDLRDKAPHLAESIVEEMDKEIIICSAIKCPDGYIVRGHRHHDCIRTISEIQKYKDNYKGDKNFVQGFITSKNKFVNRNKAYEIFKNLAWSEKGQLYSEDVY